MPRGLHPCRKCGEIIGNAAKRCRHCGDGEAAMSRGYRRVYVPGHPVAARDGYALEHRWLLCEMAIPIPAGYHVHHKNGDKSDNRWSNLAILPAAEHRRHHLHSDGIVTNQYGTFPIATTDQERKERVRAQNQKRAAYKLEWYRRKRAASGRT